LGAEISLAKSARLNTRESPDSVSPVSSVAAGPARVAVFALLALLFALDPEEEPPSESGFSCGRSAGAVDARLLFGADSVVEVAL
jgi:hypothetical protein